MSAVYCAVEREDKVILVRVLGLGADVDKENAIAVFRTGRVGTPLVRH